jgi:hypothetical protein
MSAHERSSQLAPMFFFNLFSTIEVVPFETHIYPQTNAKSAVGRDNQGAAFCAARCDAHLSAHTSFIFETANFRLMRKYHYQVLGLRTPHTFSTD